MYNILVEPLYNFRSDPPDKSSTQKGIIHSYYNINDYLPYSVIYIPK